MKITIVGSGYVGLVTGTCFAEVGIEVTCVDIDSRKIENLRKGIIPIYEPGLEPIVMRNIDKGRLFFSTDLKSVISQGTDMVFTAVGTPPSGDGSADLQYVINVAREIGRYMQDYLLVVTKSTVPVGTSEKVRHVIQEELDKRGVNIPFDVASNPEFLKEGDAINDFLKPDRIVVGIDSERAQDIFERLYKPFTLNGHPIIFMDIPSAEMTKYAANSMLATKISFMNDIVNLCELVVADVNMVRKGICSDSRIGTKFIYPGIGYGGSCFPKDVKALIRTAAEKGYQLSVLKAVEEVNENQKLVLYKKLNSYYSGQLNDKTIAIWGLSFKPNTDDMREAPSISLIHQLLSVGAKVKAYDPVAMNEARQCYFGDQIEYSKDQYEATIDADALLLVTEWPEFKFPNFNVVKKLMRHPVVFDGRNIYSKQEMKDMGFDYFGIGIPSLK